VIVEGRWRWILGVGMVLGALNIGLRDAYRCAIRGGFSVASSSGIMDLVLFYIYFWGMPCLRDGRLSPMELQNGS
jgi:hypothetical protein